MSRTTVLAVQKVLGANYGPLPDGTSPSLAPYIETASNTVAQAIACAADDGVILTAVQTELMERWLAAYYYTVMDPVYTSRSTLSASGSFATAEDRYKKVAEQMDPSGCLKTILDGNIAGAFWAGKPKSAQIDYDQRD